MPSARQLSQSQISSTNGNWDSLVNANAARVLAWLNGSPFPLKRFYRVSGSNTSYPACLNLVAFNAAEEEGGLAYLKDPESGQTPMIYSNGVNWKYVKTDTNVTGIA
jgi:hypothetical protein